MTTKTFYEGNLRIYGSTDEVLSTTCSSVKALQGLTHHLKGYILFSITPLTAAAQIIMVRDVIKIFSPRLLNLGMFA